MSADSILFGFPYITMPEAAPSSDHVAVFLKADVEVIEKGTERADVKNAQPVPILRTDSRKNGEDGGLRLASSGWSDQQAMFSVLNRLDALFL